MKIHIPSDYHAGFQLAVKTAQLNEEGRLSAAFDLVGFSEEAIQHSGKWASDLNMRRMILERCELRLMLGGHVPNPELMAVLDDLSEQVATLPQEPYLSVDDKGAAVLREALETFARLSMGQVDRPLEAFSYKGEREGLREEVCEVINDMRHLAITKGGESLGMANEYVSDDARNAYLAQKFIAHHLACKRNPEGNHGSLVPFRHGRCSDQDITIQDAEYKPARSTNKAVSKGIEPNF